jgi:hypothetical protein
MASMNERVENIKQCAEERSQLQLSCLDKLDLSTLKTANDIAKARYEFEMCNIDNASHYPCVAKRQTALLSVFDNKVSI